MLIVIIIKQLILINPVCVNIWYVSIKYFLDNFEVNVASFNATQLNEIGFH